MQTCWFIVVEVNGRWFVDCEGKSYGPFTDKETAIGEGTSLASVFGDGRRQSELWVRDTDASRPRRVWSGPRPASWRDTLPRARRANEPVSFVRRS